jgi:hypothetical protein
MDKQAQKPRLVRGLLGRMVPACDGGNGRCQNPGIIWLVVGETRMCRAAAAGFDHKYEGSNR